MADGYNCAQFCQDSSASEHMDLKVLWHFKDINGSSSEIQACRDFGVSSVGIFRTAP